MSIPHTFNPLGAPRREDWYNWSPGYLAFDGTVEENADYLTSDYIAITTGALSFWATHGPKSIAIMVYNSAFKKLGAWGGGSPTGVVRRNIDIQLAGATYLRLNVLRDDYDKSKVVQGGVTLFDGDLHPPKSL